MWIEILRIQIENTKQNKKTNIQESQAYNVDRNPFIVERRGYRDLDRFPA